MLLRFNHGVFSLSLAALAGCGDDPERGTSPDLSHVLGRPDLEVLSVGAPVRQGRTRRIPLDIDDRTSSFLIELRGAMDGFYFLDEFITPVNTELSASGYFVTREAREVHGLADFLFPNDGVTVVEPGRYQLRFESFVDREAEQPLLDDALDARVYLVNRDPDDVCGLRLDFLVDRNAVETSGIELAVDLLVERIAQHFWQVRIAIIDYQIQRIDLSDPDVDVGSKSVLAVAENVLAQARQRGGARQDAVHILFVRSIGGEMTPDFNPNGYSMGLPGPYDANRPNSTVLVASSLFAEEDAAGDLVLDVDGLATTLSHEIGHYLGLYHTSESGGRAHDPLLDTPECSSAPSCSNDFLVNLMTSSSWLRGAGRSSNDRNRFTADQGRVMRSHPLCMPYSPPGVISEVCSAQCNAPSTCVTLDDIDGCAVACDPTTAPCTLGECRPDQRGTLACL